MQCWNSVQLASFMCSITSSLSALKPSSANSLKTGPVVCSVKYSAEATCLSSGLICLLLFIYNYTNVSKLIRQWFMGIKALCRAASACAGSGGAQRERSGVDQHVRHGGSRCRNTRAKTCTFIPLHTVITLPSPRNNTLHAHKHPPLHAPFLGKIQPHPPSCPSQQQAF